MADESPLLPELAAFNEHRRQQLRDKPIAPGERMPLPHSGVGGDVGPCGDDE